MGFGVFATIVVVVGDIRSQRAELELQNNNSAMRRRDRIVRRGCVWGKAECVLEGFELAGLFHFNERIKRYTTGFSLSGGQASR